MPPMRLHTPLMLGILLWGCGSGDDALDCHDLLAPDQTHYSQLEALFLHKGGKGCASSDCHGDSDANNGYRFDVPSEVYDALTTRPDIIYGEIAAGSMPQGGTHWSEADLRLFRSWYCNGEFPQ